VAIQEEAGLDYFVLDVFTRNRLQGNPLAVVINPGHLTSETMLRIAGEMNLSETTFVERRPSAQELTEGVRVRIFTTQEELPFAGHPTLGTASLLRAIAPECIQDNTLKLALNVGTVPVRFRPTADGDAPWPVFGEMTQKDPVFGEELDSATVAALIGLDAADLSPESPVQVVSTGTAFAIVRLRSFTALARLKMRQEESSAFLGARGARWFYVVGPTGTQEAGMALWRARMQFNGGEDPATGSAAGCAISYLVRHGAIPSNEKILMRQGIEMGRPSELYLSARLARPEIGGSDDPQADVTEVRVAGSTIVVAKGRLFLP
jgi:trans-2,3-dihydro-3-hydroxyanthranilate isomerase